MMKKLALTLTTLVSAPGAWAQLVCTADIRTCKDGSFVPRDPLNDCNFKLCPDELFDVICGNNPCPGDDAQGALAQRTQCVPLEVPQQCFTPPCPQYDCVVPSDESDATREMPSGGDNDSSSGAAAVGAAVKLTAAASTGYFLLDALQ